jgi:hypothetical protein
MSHYTDDELTLYYYREAPRRERIEQHLETCESCAATYRDVACTLALVGDLDVPERDQRYGLEIWQRIRRDLPMQDAPWHGRLWVWHRSVSMAGAAMLVVTAFAAGRFWPQSDPAPQDDLRAANLIEVRRELREMRELLMLSLLQQQSATERLRGVSGSVQIERPGTEIIHALLETLTHDPNVNVRLACVDALRRFSEEDIVRRGTVQALAASSSPLVQIALIDFIVESKDKDAINALRRLSEDSTMDEAVRGRAAWGVEQLNLRG